MHPRRKRPASTRVRPPQAPEYLPPNRRETLAPCVSSTASYNLSLRLLLLCAGRESNPRTERRTRPRSAGDQCAACFDRVCAMRTASDVVRLLLLPMLSKRGAQCLRRALRLLESAPTGERAPRGARDAARRGSSSTRFGVAIAGEGSCARTRCSCRGRPRRHGYWPRATSPVAWSPHRRRS
jgi:hypothetical protein